MRETRNQIDDLMNEIRIVVERGERTLVTTLTKKMSEDLTDYLLEMGFKVRYLHSEIDTLERIQIIRDLRLGEYDVLVGVNLLREGLDLPEVSLVAILDADKEGFLRGETSLIQTIGRAARNVEGKVLMYADKETDAMRAALGETDRRRAIQLAYNEQHGITAATIVKGISDIAEFLQSESKLPGKGKRRRKRRSDRGDDAVRAREDDRRARGGDARRRRGAALRVRGARARRDPRPAPRADHRAGQRGARLDMTAAAGPASWWSRVGAALVDLVVRFAIAAACVGAGAAAFSGIDGDAGDVGLGIGIGLALILTWFVYAPLLMARWDGQTVGHRATRTRVVMADGSRMTGGRAFVREVLVKNLLIETFGTLLFLILPLIDYLLPLFDDDNAALHDKICETRVVNT